MDRFSKEKRSEIMSKIRGKNTKPELIVRKLAFSLGYRYRLHGQGLPGKPDLVFKSKRKLIFVHGCYWHCHGAKSCKKGHIPKSNRRYWSEKFLRNIARDRANLRKLRAADWSSLILWECQLSDLNRIEMKILRFLG